MDWIIQGNFSREKMKLRHFSSLAICFLLVFISLAHTESQSNDKRNSPLFGSVMRYFGESETGYGAPSSGLFEQVEASQQVSTCLHNFEVSEGSIIRTKDSQALGAHYLNETDLGDKSKDECLKLCCKVPRCNVAVFEEKNAGSCYLFDCGSLEDFRCKFTSQSLYVSAILRHRDAVSHNRNSPEHSGSSSSSIMDAHTNGHSHNQHEDELSQLRDSEKTLGGLRDPVVPAAVVAGTSNVADGVGGNSKSKQSGRDITQNGQSISLTTSSSTSSPVVLSDGSNDSSRRCTRWQFECKSTGECIAIYNACDSIPNCPDGSDESPEHCPAANAFPAVGSVASDASSNLNKGNKATSSMGAGAQHPEQPQSSSSQHSHHPQPPVLINTLPKQGEVMPQLPKSLGPYRQNEEYPQLTNNMKPQQQVGESGGGVNGARARSDIFQHKGGISDSFGNRQPHSYPNQYWKQNANYDYNNIDSQPGYGPLPPPPPPQYSNMNPYGSGSNYGNAQYPYGAYPNLQGPPQQSSQQGLPMIPQQAQQPYQTNYIPQQPPQPPYYNRQPSSTIQGNNPLLPIGVNNQATNLAQSSNAGNPAVAPAPSNTGAIPSNPVAPPQATTVKPSGGSQATPQNNSIKGSLSKGDSDLLKSLTAQALQVGGTADVQSEELSPHTAGAGAVFIFMLGLGMSVVMVIIVGCRLRRVSRRQRGKNRLDPDYLVDGMYL